MTLVTRFSGNCTEENIYGGLSEISVTICHLSPDMPCSSSCQKLVAVGWRLCLTSANVRRKEGGNYKRCPHTPQKLTSLPIKGEMKRVRVHKEARGIRGASPPESQS